MTGYPLRVRDLRTNPAKRGWCFAPTLGCVELLMRPGKRQNQLGDPGTQSPQLMSPLGFSSVGSSKSVTFYSLAHNCRFPKDLGCALR